VSREDEREADEHDADAATESDVQRRDSRDRQGDIARGDDDTQDERAVDETATAFVEVEQELAHLGDGQRARGQAIDVEQVSASEVPEGYPVQITTPDALALTLELSALDGRTVRVFFEWPEQGVSDRLETLLALCDVPVDRFADLHGKTMLITVEDGFYLPVIPAEGLRGDPRAKYALAAGMAPPALVTLSGIFGVGTGAVFTTPFVVLWLLATLVVVPLAIYADAWYLRTHADWDGGPLFWATLSVVPMFEIVVVPLYLLARANAEPLG